MATQKKPRRRVRFVYQRSSLVTKIVVLITLILTTAALLALTISIRNNRTQAEADRQKAAQLEHQNASLAQGIKDAGSVEGDKQYAENELGYVDGQAVILTPVSPEGAAPREDTGSTGIVLLCVALTAVSAAALFFFIYKTKWKKESPVSDDKTDITPRS